MGDRIPTFRRNLVLSFFLFFFFFFFFLWFHSMFPALTVRFYFGVSQQLHFFCRVGLLAPRQTPSLDGQGLFSQD
jgi:hypothetical protein